MSILSILLSPELGSHIHQLEGVHRTACTIADFVYFDDFIPQYVDPKGKKEVDEDADETGAGDVDKAGSSH